MNTNEFVASVHRSFHHANTVLAMVRHNHIKFRGKEEEFSVHILDEVAAESFKFMTSTPEGRFGLQLVAQLVATGRSMSGVVEITPISLDFKTSEIAYDVSMSADL